MSLLPTIINGLGYIFLIYLFTKWIARIEQRIIELADAQLALQKFIADRYSAVIKDRNELAELVREATESVIEKNKQADAPDEEPKDE